MSILGSIANAFLGPVLGVIDKAVEDKDKAAQLKQEITMAAIAADTKALEAQVSVIVAEAQGQSWLQRNWRPVLMLVITAIVANNYLIAPYLGAMFNVGLMLELPEPLWNLMTLGVGGYVAGRTVEKSIETWKKK